SAVMPYVFIVFLGLGLLVTTMVSGIFQRIGTQNIMFFGHPRSLGPLAGLLIYLMGVTGEILLLSSIYLAMPVGRLSLRHALIGGATAAVLWEITRQFSSGTTRPCRRFSWFTGRLRPRSDRKSVV